MFKRNIIHIIEKINRIRDENELIREFPRTYGRYFHIDKITFLQVEIRRHKDRTILEPVVSFRNAIDREAPVIYPDSSSELNTCFNKRKSVKKIYSDGSVKYLFPIVDYNAIHYVLALEFNKRDVGDYKTFRTTVNIFLNHFALVRSQDRDFLTGLYNRRAFDRMVGSFSRYKQEHREEHDYLALLDLDYFKRINDTYGHMIGDEVLVLIARMLRNITRVEDTIFRLGGEEFLIYAKDLNIDEARYFFERLRAKIEHELFPRNLNLTVSIGYVQMSYGSNPNIIVDYADQAMYTAKKEGRNLSYYYGDLVTQGKIKPAETYEKHYSVWE